MNKQEAIEEIKKQSTQAYDDFAIMRDTAIHIVNQIDEPQKPVVSKFVAEWYEENKYNFEYNVKCLCVVHNWEPLREIDTWFESGDTKPFETLVMMHKFGYEIEKEKLYTVEIPDPNSMYKQRFLSRNGNGVCIDASNDNYWKQRRENRFTESEIKEDFEWAFQFAKPVEE